MDIVSNACNFTLVCSLHEAMTFVFDSFTLLGLVLYWSVLYCVGARNDEERLKIREFDGKRFNLYNYMRNLDYGNCNTTHNDVLLCDDLIRISVQCLLRRRSPLRIERCPGQGTWTPLLMLPLSHPPSHPHAHAHATINMQLIF
jgi:hypothetical protein